MKKDLSRHLSPRDLVELMNLSYRSLAFENYNDLKRLVLDLQRLFFFENALCAQGNVLELIHVGKKPAVELYDVSYPSGYLDLYFDKQFFYTDAVLDEFINHLSPVNWLSVDKKCSINYPASVMALDFNMNDGWTHGILDLDTMNITVFFLGSHHLENNSRTVKILEYIIPFYAEAYKRALKKTSRPSAPLTPKEIEVLNWIKEGKSSWDISNILQCAESTVNFHIKNIKRKLNVVNRAQAVAVGLQHKIIGF